MTFLRPGEGPQLTALGSTYTTKADSAATNNAYVLLEEEFWGDPTPLHSHDESEEAFYVLSGEVAVWVDTTETLATQGAFIVVPRRKVHGLRRVTDAPVRLLTLVSPPGFERFFEEVVREGEQELLRDPERLAELASRSGTRVLGDYPLP